MWDVAIQFLNKTHSHITCRYSAGGKYKGFELIERYMNNTEDGYTGFYADGKWAKPAEHMITFCSDDGASSDANGKTCALRFRCNSEA